MRKWRRATAVLALLAAGAAAPPEWRIARPDYAWSFPRDHWARQGYRTEWWYFTGHLEAIGDPERRFGFQFTFFRLGILGEPPPLDSEWAAADLILGHAAITDLERGEHRFSEVLRRAVPFLGGFNPYPAAAIAWCRGPAGTDDSWSLHWNGEAFDVAARDQARGIGFQLSTRPLRPRSFQGPNGYSRKGEGESAASLYYSFPRLATEGSLEIDGRRFEVRGLSWMDKEFGSGQLGPQQVGWDWFSLQLDDGRDLMLYLLRREDGTVDFSRGTLFPTAGDPRYLEPAEFRIRATGSWRSPESGVEYPSGWRIEVPAAGLSVEVAPLLASQENRGTRAGRLAYWEGAVEVRDGAGRHAGQGYVELTGYGEGNRPGI